MTRRITYRPITYQQVEAGAKALWDQHREAEGRVRWEDAVPWAREPYEQKAQIVLEVALPHDADFLRRFAQECLDVAEIL